MRDWEMRHQTARVENAGLETAKPTAGGGKCVKVGMQKIALVCHHSPLS